MGVARRLFWERRGSRAIAMASCGGCGPGYATPRDAYYSGNQEKLVYLPCIIEDKTRPDYLATVDTDPASPTYSQVISRLHFPYLGDEIHHTGWNACSSCYDDPSRSRSRLIVLALGSDRIYVVDVKSDPSTQSWTRSSSRGRCTPWAWAP